MNESKSYVFNIKDYMYLISYMNFFILGLICYFVFYKNPLELEVSTASSNPIALMVTWALLGKGLYGIISFYKNKYKITFHKNTIINNSKNVEMHTTDIREIYRISFFLNIDDYFTIRRQHLIAKIVLTIISPIILIYFIFNTIFKILYFKKIIIHDLLVIIGKNDTQTVKIKLPLNSKEEQKQFEDYCKKYLNTDITKLKTRFFIPNKVN